MKSEFASPLRGRAFEVRETERKKDYATTLVDPKNHRVFDVVLVRSEASLPG